MAATKPNAVKTNKQCLILSATFAMIYEEFPLIKAEATFQVLKYLYIITYTYVLSCLDICYALFPNTLKLITTLS